MKKYLGLIVIALVLISCDPLVYTMPVVGGINQSEQVVTTLEDVTGQKLSPSVVNRGEQITTGINKAAKFGSGLTAIIPGAEVATPFLLAITAISGALAGFFKRRKDRSEKTAIALAKALDKVRDGGKAAVAAAKTAGVSDDVEKLYLKHVA